jgi:ABC-type lipoprotein release transport system permease subunit
VKVVSWWRRLFASRRMERDLDSELRFHVAFLGTTIVLGSCATVAGFIRARRAASIDPMRALRSE